MLLGGIGLGAGLGSVTAWLWLKGLGYVFSSFLALAAVTAGVAGAWIAFRYGTGVEPECCASPAMGPVAYAVIGAVISSNLATLVCGVTGQTLVRNWRRRNRVSPETRLVPQAEETFSR
jgi:branched-subunit amino acid ABC-type transport system permease component